MTQTVNPFLGLCKDNLHQPRKHKVKCFTRYLVVGNIERLMNVRYKESTNKPKAFATDAGISLSSVQRIMAGDSGITLETLEAIADALGVTAYQLLLPNLDIKNPQTINGAEDSEYKLYSEWLMS